MSTGLVSGLPPPPSLGVAGAAKDWSCGWMRARELAWPCHPPSSGGISQAHSSPTKGFPPPLIFPAKGMETCFIPGQRGIYSPSRPWGYTRHKIQAAISSNYLVLRPHMMEGWGAPRRGGGRSTSPAGVSNFTIKALIWFRCAPSPWTQRWPLSRPHAQTECGQGTHPWILPHLRQSGAQSDARGKTPPQPTVTP